MVDTPIGSYATETTDVAQLVGMKAAGNLINVDTTKFANSLSASGATGDMYRRNSSSNVERFAIGSTGNILTVESGLPAWKAGGMTLISSTTVSVAVSSVAFTNIPSSGYSHFVLIVINGESAVAGTSDPIRVQVSTDNGSTWKTAGTDYYKSAVAQAYLTSVNFSGSTSTNKVGSHHIVVYGLGNANRATAALTLENVYGISATSITQGTIAGNDGVRAAKEADNAIRFVSSGGSNIAGGTFLIYGVSE